MGVFAGSIEKAIRRAQNLDLPKLVGDHRAKVPDELITADDRRARADFLAQSLGQQVAQVALERVLSGNELQDANYLSRGVRAVMAVGRILASNPNGPGRLAGTGFLIAPNVLITNNHVLPSPEMAASASVDFNFQLDDAGQPSQPSTYRFEPTKLFHTSERLDFTVVAVSKTVVEGEPRELDYFGCLPLLAVSGKAVEGEWLTIVQHPEGRQKMLCIRENQLLRRVEDVLWYSSDTMGGSSGSPVFNNDWFVVALHHSGVPETRNGKIQTRDGHDYDQLIHSEMDIKWIANEGIRATRIVEALRSALPNHDMLKPLFVATPHSARVAEGLPVAGPAEPNPFRNLESFSHNISHQKGTQMSRTVQVTLRIDENGQASVVDSRANESVALEARRASAEKSKPKVKVKFDDNYKSPKRKGFISDFLGGGKDAFYVHRPELTPSKKKLAAPLLDNPDKHELDYIGYTVVMNAPRKLAMYSAASIDFEGRSMIDSRTDTWRPDPRIDEAHQLDDSYYENKRAGRQNLFDKGHLTRNEDMEYGANVEKAAESAVDTFHYTNRAPQHQNFNRRTFLWQDLELHILENSIKANNFRAQVITGPVLAANDPVFKAFGKEPYPEKFWKVAIAVNAKDELVAVAFLLDQSGVIDDDGLEGTGDLPFKPFREFQVTVTEIERLTGLIFSAGKGVKKKRLSEFDPLEGKIFNRRKRSSGSMEATGSDDVPEGYVPLTGLESVVLE